MKSAKAELLARYHSPHDEANAEELVKYTLRSAKAEDEAAYTLKSANAEEEAK